MKVAIGSDHAGFALKERIKRELESLGHTVTDVGTTSATESVDYPDFAIPVGERVASGEADRGVVMCATGIGASIAANKVSNVLALGGRTTPNFDDAARWLKIWLETPFAGGRHERRVKKIEDYEQHHTLKR
jgi:ribose 5-phosphate isomerase B